MSLVNIKIEGQPYQVEAGLTILEAAKACGYEIPSLCAFNHGECNQGSCRVCLVEATGARGLVASCVYPVAEGMEIKISSPAAVQARRRSVELMLSNHNKNCQQCDKNGQCELLHVAQITGAREDAFQGVHSETHIDTLAPGLIRDTSKCILCGRCIARCSNAHGMGILGFENRGFATFVSPAENRSFADSPCIQCGQCVNVCPTGALMEHSEIDKVDAAFKAGKHVIVQAAPAVRAAIGEEFDNPVGTPCTGKMIAALRRLGFERVYDVNFGADLTIMEEGTELLGRLQNGGVLPMITSCSPGWIKYIEYEYPELLPHLSTSKSPHMMFGAIVKSYWAKQHGVDPKDIYVVSIMPCIAKKSEIMRPENKTAEYVDVDAVLTTRELGRLIKLYGIEFNDLPDEEFDQDLLGDYTGAAVIFGATGGVMEAALRTVKQQLDGKPLEKVDFEACRGMAGVKEAEIDLNGTKIWIAIASSMTCAKPLLEEVKAGTSKYTFIEIMGCPGGCVNGGGQSIVPSKIKNGPLGYGYKELRMKALYDEDEACKLRVSSDNPQIQKLYSDFLEKPGSEIAEELLHTSYSPKQKFHIFD